MKITNLLTGFLIICSGVACSDGEERDDTILDMSYLTGKDWYYNGWLGEKYSFAEPDLLEVVRFEKGGTMKSMDFSGRREYVVGTWSSEGNKINLEYKDRETVVWNVQHSGEDYIKAIVNAQGTREYVTDLGYLGDLTADAFLVNEYTSGNQFRTYIGADVRGNRDVREVSLITNAGNIVALDPHGYYWSESVPTYIDFNGKSREVRFYLRIGKNTELKLRDSIYSENLPQRTPAEVALTVNSRDGEVQVEWNPYSNQKVYYKVEVYPQNMDLKNPYFVSRVQAVGSDSLLIRNSTAGELNQMNNLKAGDTYTVRLTALLYEPGIDPINDNYGYANIQAMSYFTKMFVWE